MSRPRPSCSGCASCATSTASCSDQHGILLVADEVQTGAGRTGTFFAMEQMGVAADIVTMAKSLAGGFPLSAVVGRAEVMDAPAPGGLGGTYAGSPLGCAAALAVLQVFEKDKLLERSRAVGGRLTAGLQALAAQHKAIGDVRGLGAMVAIELFIVAEGAKRGLILLSCGVYGNVIRILVPLTASDALLDEGMAILGDTLRSLC